MWEPGKQYRFRGVPGNLVLRKTTTGKPLVQAIVEVVLGPELGARLNWKGYLTTDDIAGETARDLRTMGCKGELGDATGFGSREFLGTAMCDEGTGENAGKKYWRVAFIRELLTLDKDDDRNLPAAEVEALNRRFPQLFKQRTNGAPSSSQEPPPGRFDDVDENLEFPPT